MTDRMLFTSRSTFFRPSVVCVVIAAALPAVSAWAVEPFVVKDIRVEGLQRSDAGTVFASLPFRVGDTYATTKAPRRCGRCSRPASTRTCASMSTATSSS